MISSSHFSVRSSGARVLAWGWGVEVNGRMSGCLICGDVRVDLRRVGEDCGRFGRMKTL